MGDEIWEVQTRYTRRNLDTLQSGTQAFVRRATAIALDRKIYSVPGSNKLRDESLSCSVVRVVRRIAELGRDDVVSGDKVERIDHRATKQDILVIHWEFDINGLKGDIRGVVKCRGERRFDERAMAVSTASCDRDIAERRGMAEGVDTLQTGGDVERNRADRDITDGSARDNVCRPLEFE